MSFVMFLLGLVAGAAALAVLLVPRLRAAVDAARRAREAERAAAVGCRARLPRTSGRLAELRAATEEKIALVGRQPRAARRADEGDLHRHAAAGLRAGREDRCGAAGGGSRDRGRRARQARGGDQAQPGPDHAEPQARRRSGRAARARPADDAWAGAADVRVDERGGRAPARPDRDARLGAQAAAGPRGVGRDAAAQLRRRGEHDRARRLRLAGERERLRRRPAAARPGRAPAGRA